jgi:Holliday junction resolvase-like predicted endonuclease
LFDFQRRLALGEAIAHLVYLRARGEVERVTRDDGTIAYIKVRRRHTAQAAG